MKVKLLTYTPEPEKIVAAAAKLCYSNKADIESLMNDLTKPKIEKFVSHLESLGHGSPFEHVYFTFGIEGVSRALTHQLVRHRHSNFDQRSQRYCSEDNFEYILPDSIEANDEARIDFRGLMGEISKMYKKLVDLGIPKEDARFILPNACASRLICTMNARELYHFFNLRCCCYDDKTEVLTNDGWKFFKNLNHNELFYSLNPETNKVEFVKAKDYIDELYIGKMITVDSQSISLKVTPNHKMYVSYSYDNKKFHFDDAKNCNIHKTVLMKKNNLPIEGVKDEIFIIPGVTVHYGAKTKKDKTINSKKVEIHDFMRFIGMFICDGYTNISGYHCIVGISKGSKEKIDKYASILKKLSENTVRVFFDRHCWKVEVHDRRLYEYCSKLGKTLKKHIPQEFFKYDSSILESLLEGLLDGDANSGEQIFYTSSVQLKDDFQRLLLHVGYSVTVGVDDRRSEGHIIRAGNGEQRMIYPTVVGYRLSINRSKNEPIIKRTPQNAFSEEDYNGHVYCVDLEKNHLLYVRRNGKTVWCGNSRAQWEIRGLANRMLALVKDVSPVLFKNAGASCVQGFCPEGDMSCGKAPTLEQLLAKK